MMRLTLVNNAVVIILGIIFFTGHSDIFKSIKVLNRQKASCIQFAARSLKLAVKCVLIKLVAALMCSMTSFLDFNLQQG